MILLMGLAIGREAREEGYVCARSEMARTQATHLSNKLKLDGRTGEHLMAGIHQQSRRVV